MDRRKKYWWCLLALVVILLAAVSWAGLHFSLEIAQRAGERLTFYLWTPRPVAETLIRQLRATYAGLEVVTQLQADYLEAAPEEAAWAWADLGLAGEAWLPLRTDFAGDPLTSLLSALEGLSPGGDLAAVQFLLRPASGDWARAGQAAAAKLRGDGDAKRPRLSAPERERLKQIEAKIARPGYDLCLRLIVAGRGDVAGNLERLCRAFDLFAGENSVAVRAGGDAAQLGRLRGRFFPAGWSAGVAGVRKLAALAHLPGGEVAGVSLARAGMRVLKPGPACFSSPDESRIDLGRFIDIPTFTGGLAGVPYPLAALRPAQPVRRHRRCPPDTGSADRPIGVKLLDARRHFHVIGPTGVGKSTMLLRMVWQYMLKFPQAAVWVQEPHQDLTHKIIRRIPLAREKDVIWLDVMDAARVLGVNPLDVPPGADPNAVVAEVMGVIKKVMGASWDTAVQMQEILENSLLAVLRMQPQPTLAHLFKIMTDADYRFDLTARLDDPIAATYWQSLELKKEREAAQFPLLLAPDGERQPAAGLHSDHLRRPARARPGRRAAPRPTRRTRPAAAPSRGRRPGRAGAGAGDGLRRRAPGASQPAARRRLARISGGAALSRPLAPQSADRRPSLAAG